MQDIVLCKIYRKAKSMKVMEQKRAVMEDEIKPTSISPSPLTTPTDSMSFCNRFCNGLMTPNEIEGLAAEEKFSMDWNLQEYSLWTLENLTPFLPMC